MCHIQVKRNYACIVGEKYITLEIIMKLMLTEEKYIRYV